MTEASLPPQSPPRLPQSPPRLSVCIPTHHGRGAVLQEAITSVLVQITPALREQVQICISDNASEDETQAVVERCMSENPGLFVYLRHPVNLGLTRNLLSLINIAQGDYCWLLSSDDTMAEHGLSKVLTALTQNPALTGLTVDLSYYDRGMTCCVRENMPAILLPCYPERAQVFTSPPQIFRECGSVQGGFSMQVFDRKLWVEALEDVGEAEYMSFHLFPYVYLFGKMVKKRPLWLWLPEKLVQSRTDNDFLSQELNQNALKYQTCVMQELSRIWGSLFGPFSATRQSLVHANSCLFWSGPSLLIYKSRFFCTAADEVKALVVWTRCLFLLPAFWTTILPMLLLPSFVLRPLFFALKRTGWIPILRTWKQQWTQRGQGKNTLDVLGPL